MTLPPTEGIVFLVVRPAVRDTISLYWVETCYTYSTREWTLPKRVSRSGQGRDQSTRPINA